MAIEKLLEELNANLAELNENIKKMTAAAKIGSEKAAAKAAEKAPAKADDEDEDKEEKKARRSSKKKDEDEDKEEKKSRAKKLKAKDVVDLAQEYLSTEDDDEYQARRENIKTILNKLGEKKLSEIEDQDNLRKAYDVITALMDGQDLAEIEGFGSSRRRKEDDDDL